MFRSSNNWDSPPSSSSDERTVDDEEELSENKASARLAANNRDSFDIATAMQRCPHLTSTRIYAHQCNHQPRVTKQCA